MAVRPESSVSLELNGYGEIEFACDRPGPVIHRTPEELGIAREVKEVQPRGPSWFKPSPDFGRGSLARDVRRRAKPAKASVSADVEEPLRVIGGEAVRMPVRAVMGAEPLDGFIAERASTGNRVQGTGSKGLRKQRARKARE